MNNPDQSKRILLASVLKPVDEPRAFEKIGQSLAAAGYKIFITGSSPSSKQTVDGIAFIAHEKLERISWARIAARFKILNTAFRLKPDLLIVSTHELMGVALIYRMCTGKKIIYDVQENYFKNILYTHAFQKSLRPLVAGLVRLKEIIVSFFFSGFILAEKCYEQELGFVKKKICVIENKCRVPIGFARNQTQDSIQLIFTGTLAESTGIFQAIDIAKRLHALDSKIKLDIIGFCPLPHVLQRIKNEIQSCHFILLKGGNHFISHQEIFDSIASANFGIISYPPSPHTKNRIPTKLYEYLACGLPVLMQVNSVWRKTSEKYKAAIYLDFTNYDAPQILHQLKLKSTFQPVEDANWKREEVRLLSFLESI